MSNAVFGERSMSCGGQKGIFHIVTPTIRSTPISKKTGFDVYLKLENLQVSGSFKIRGVENRVIKVGPRNIQVYL